MNKKWLLIPILVLTGIIVIVIITIKINPKYNKLIINESNWNNIISTRETSTSISIDKIKLNDYDLLIDEENNVIYYSVIESNNKYNPYIDYKLNNKNIKLAINKEINDDLLEDSDTLKIMIYDDTSYRIYSLVVTNYPILNVSYNTDDEDKKVDMNFYLFDNYVDSPNKVLKSEGKLKTIEENKKYSFSLKKESLGHNERKNPVSIFGMPKQNEYIIKSVDSTNEKERYVRFFINNKYIGLFELEHNEQKEINNFERNRENNK